MNITTPTDAWKDFYQLLKDVNNNHEPVFINGKNKKNNAVIVSQEDWNSIQETMYLEVTGTMDKVREREKDNSGTSNIDDIDWNQL
ncbi:type II toxin-antitoxin system Phd/YefM family antitoxin [Staphylococcus simiae]|uniref:Antitoxin n=1 Tax=Staphylococcus simiae CCM 7213 = CCUG 51256 TaxID=911238 RepID=G5JHX8_9STAP|nr:type II toxin-antitoxin system Phd/YefM family antitoxin [Staphylococcus simiae]EHJ08171.1 addiction module antitoxin [Staphylococcus simiae CCM 7213 = CCUG 51256]PNZ14297.1 type II toxin-antitoxin system Phd/YefM family antitoxin [Staphylococcus simiae]SNV81500.1 prevent-host-death family protein [Staphylococcus simiae]